VQRLKIKQVPDEAPNADGEWVEREADSNELSRPGMWTYLSTLCDAGHHAVAIDSLESAGTSAEI
jgi:hypothetical protein